MFLFLRLTSALLVMLCCLSAWSDASALQPRRPAQEACRIVNLLAYCGRVGLQEVPSGLPVDLISLDLTGNSFTQINPQHFDSLTSLTDLILDQNSLTTIPPKAFAKLTSLERLNLNNNNISGIDADAFNLDTGSLPLTTLQLQSNLLTALPAQFWTDLNGLQNLHLDKNRITDISALNLDSATLLYLSLAYNQITTLPEGYPFEKVPKMEALRLDNNQMVSFPQQGLHFALKLKLLNVSHNKFSVVSEFYPQTNTLLTLDVSHNFFTSFPKAIHLPNLLRLNLSSNPIATVGADDLSQKTEKIQELSLRKCSISTLPVGLKLADLKQLDLGHNQITDVEDLKLNSMKLEIISLDNNQITSLSDRAFGDLRELREVRLNDNLLTQVNQPTFHNLGALQTILLGNNRFADAAKLKMSHGEVSMLDLSHNALTSFPSDMVFSKLATLLLAHNDISSIPHTSLIASKAVPKLHQLDLTGNTITQFSISNFPDMHTLRLSSNGITDLTRFQFAPSKLKFLRLDKNNLTSVTTNVFKDISTLQGLQLDDNRLTHLPPLPKSLQYLHAIRNRITHLDGEMFNHDNGPTLAEIRLNGNNMQTIANGVFNNMLNRGPNSALRPNVNFTTFELFNNPLSLSAACPLAVLNNIVNWNTQQTGLSDAIYLDNADADDYALRAEINRTATLNPCKDVPLVCDTFGRLGCHCRNDPPPLPSATSSTGGSGSSSSSMI
eukprot:scpid53596/ scgid13651/ Insulin-like growth factor-binding protein complex acid labile subunit